MSQRKKNKHQKTVRANMSRTSGVELGVQFILSCEPQLSDILSIKIGAYYVTFSFIR